MPPTGPCFKCKKKLGRIASRDGICKMYCGHCFTEFCTKTTRDQLFSHCYLPCEEPVAVGVSGGPHSLLLLHQLGILRKQGELRQGAGTVNFELLPFHLREDELVLPPLPSSSCSPESSVISSSAKDSTRSVKKTSHFEAEDTARTQRVRETLLQQFDRLEELVRGLEGGWEYASCPLFTPGEIDIYSYSDFLTPRELQVLRGCVHHPRLSLTHREEVYERVRQRVLCLAARKRTQRWRAEKAVKRGEGPSPSSPSESPSSGDKGHAAASFPLESTNGVCENAASPGWAHLAVGDGVVRCCIAALKAIVQGGTGEQIVHQSGSRGYLANIVLLRPLRVLLTKEVILYNRLHGIRCGYTPALCTATCLPSIHRVLERFVHSLVLNYWTSAFNVLNTVKKIAVGPPAVAAVLEGLAQSPRDEPEGKGPAMREGQPSNPNKKAQKRNPTLGRSAQLYHAHLQRTEPPLHHVRRLAVEENGVRCGPSEDNPTPVLHDEEKGEEPLPIGASCFVCGCPFSANHGRVLTERVLAAVHSEEPLQREEMVYDYYVCQGCQGCLEGVLTLEPTLHPQTRQPPTAETAGGPDAGFNMEQLLGVLAALSSSF